MFLPFTVSGHAQGSGALNFVIDGAARTAVRIWQKYVDTFLTKLSIKKSQFDLMLSTTWVIRRKIVKKCLWIIQKGVIGWEQNKKRRSMGGRELKKGVNVAKYSRHQFYKSPPSHAWQDCPDSCL